jgi:hypothetical protein
MRAAQAELLESFDLERFGAALERNLPRLRIERMYLAQRLPVKPGEDGEAEVLLAYEASADDGVQPASAPRGSLPPPSAKVRLLPGIRFPARDLLPHDYVADHRPQLVKPLTFDGETLGFVAFSLGARDAYAYEMLRLVTGAFLRGYQLTQAQSAPVTGASAG